MEVLETSACEDCGEETPIPELKDTIVGYLCPDCAKRFIGAAKALAGYKAPKGK